MAKKMLIDATHSEETRVVVVQGNRLDDFDFESTNKQLVTGNIYLAKVTRVEPSLQAAFVDFGGNRHGFLAFSEIHPDYYQIPVADREALLAEEMEDNLDDDDDDDTEEQRTSSKDKDETEDRPRGRRRRPRRRRNRDKDVVEVEIETVSADDNGEKSDATSSDETTEATNTDANQGEEAVAIVTEADDAAPAKTENAAPEATEAPAQPVEEVTAEAATDDAEGEDEDGPKTVLMASDVRGDTVSEGDKPEEDNADATSSDDNDSSSDGSSDDTDGDGSAEASANDDGDEDDDADDDNDDDGDDADDSNGSDNQNITETDDVVDAEEVETDALPETEEEVAAEDNRRRRQKRQARRRYKIQEVIKRRQIILVQVVKEERGNKGAALTTYLSLAGRYCVLMPNTARGGGISRKISNVTDRKRLKSMISDLDVAKGMGLIVRTAGANRTKSEIRRDYEYLLRLWESVRQLTLKSVAPTLVYEEGNLIKRSIRDLYSKDIDSILVQGERGYREAKDFMRMIMPSHAKHVVRYKDRIPLFHRYQVESQLESMYSPVVQLKSGGYLVINPTEALVSIDINSGKSTKEHNIEDTAVKTNLEAAEEISRQLRLRDLAGLVVIDFIDMEENRNVRSVERKLKESLKHDRARIQVGRISSFGLLEMSRQRLRQGVVESSTHECPHCRGTGRVRSVESCALHVLRALEEECIRSRSSQLKVTVASEVAIYLLNQKRHRLNEMENRYRISILVDIDNELIAPSHTIERMKGALPRPNADEEEVVRADSIELSELDEDNYDDSDEDDDRNDAETDADSDSEGRGGRRRRRRRRRRGERSSDDNGNENENSADDSENEDTDNGSETDGETSEDDGESKGRRRRRGSRGRRRRGRKSDEDNDSSNEENSADGETASQDKPSEATETETETEKTVENVAPEQTAEEDKSDATAPEETAEETPAVSEKAPAEPESSEEPTEAEVKVEAADNVTSDAPEEETPPAQDETPKSRRTGWWSRRFKGED